MRVATAPTVLASVLALGLPIVDVALALQRGGVGYYAKSDFVHLDTGRVRTWAG